jgi:translation elongation factor EF-Tu-like GTPase
MKTTKSVEDSLLDFFREHSTEKYASGELQRMSWLNKNGTVATPRSVVRRLQELAEAGKITNVGTMQHAVYSLNAEVVKPKMKQVVSYTPEGTIRVSYVPV